MYVPLDPVIIDESEIDDSHTLDHAQRNHSKSIPIPAFLIIGTEKSGTSSISSALQLLPEMWAWNVSDEMHYFDGRCVRFRPVPDSLASYNISLHNFYKYPCSPNGFRNIFINKYRKETGHSHQDHGSPVYMFEKTPINIVFPHVADIIVNNFAVTGTKLIVFLRDPVYRFISGFFEQFGHSFHHENHAIIQWLHQNVNVNINVAGIKNEFSRGKPSLTLAIETQKFIANLSDNLEDNVGIDSMFRIGWLYSDFLYWIFGYFGYEKRKLIWLRGCYAPQIIIWLYFLDIHKVQNGIKIVQSESIFGEDSKRYHDIMVSLRCYIHHDAAVGGDFNAWMMGCGESELAQGAFDIFHLRGKSKGYLGSDIELQYLKDSYLVCNQWLKLLLNDMYPEIILNGWDWSLWSV